MKGAELRLAEEASPPIGEKKLYHVHLPEGKTPPGAGFWVGYFTMVILASGVPGFCWTAVKNNVSYTSWSGTRLS